MASLFPTNLDSFTTKQDDVDNVLASHVNDLQNAVVAAQTKIGINGSADTSSVDYKLSQKVDSPATNTADYIPQWDGVNSKTLKDGLAVPDGGLAGVTAVLGKKPYMGTESIGALSFDNATHILTIATGVTYWINGVKKVVTSATTCDIDTYKTLTANTIYGFYFDDTSGTLKCSDEFWDLKLKAPIAYVFWNGTAGALSREYHNYTRDVDWHINAHLTIGTRYGSGLSKTAPTTAAGATLTIEPGGIWDEDLYSTIAQQTTSRIVYQVSEGVYTFVDSSLPYAGASGAPQYLDTDTYTLTSVATGDYVNSWVYATADIDRAIYIIPTQAATAHTTLTRARAEVPPSLSGRNLSPEMKLIYKFIYKGDGSFVESVDYRNASVLPAGGTASSTASSVSFVPTGNIEAATVQSAIEELDAEKIPYTGATANVDLGPHNFTVDTNSLFVDSVNHSVGITTLDIGNNADTTLSRSAAGVLAVEGIVIPSISSTNTLTNKRITKRVASTTDSATATINSDSYDEYYLTAIANNTTISITGTPTTGQTIFIGLKDAGTTKTLTWTSITGLGVTLPTATTAGKQHIIGLKYISSAWRAIAVGVES